MREVQFVGEIDFEAQGQKSQNYFSHQFSKTSDSNFFVFKPFEKLDILGRCCFLGLNLINDPNLNQGQLIVGGQDGAVNLYQATDFARKEAVFPSYQGLILI